KDLKLFSNYNSVNILKLSLFDSSSSHRDTVKKTSSIYNLYLMSIKLTQIKMKFLFKSLCEAVIFRQHLTFI
ncbi:hypothetical protein EMPG_10780, partial [Blastomyces silverae]